MNGSIRDTVVTTHIHKVTWSDDGNARIDRKELVILLARGNAAFENQLNRQAEYDNDWWLEWGDESISFCFTRDVVSPTAPPGGAS